MNHIHLDKYSEIIKDLPILCVDVIVCNSKGKYLLIKRTNEPMKDKWWVIGGRVHKGETLKEAAIRKVKQEVGIEARNAQPIGYFELVMGTNPFGLPFKYHAISVVFKIHINESQKIKLDNQSEAFKFAKELPADFSIQPFESDRGER